MNEPNAGVVRNKSSFDRQVYDVCQIIAAVIVGIMALGMFAEISELSSPGAPTGLFWTTLAAGLLLPAALFSSVFCRWPGRVLGGLGFTTVGFLLLFNFTMNDLQRAWERTPQGAAEAKAAEQEDRLEAAADAQREKEQAAAEAQHDREEAQLQQQHQAEQQAKDQQQKLESCFSTFGHHLYDLENTVKDSLNNPHSFEHVETITMPTDADGYNAALTFRAQNGFGAIRTETLRATIDPDTCKPTNIEPEPSSL